MPLITRNIIEAAVKAKVLALATIDKKNNPNVIGVGAYWFSGDDELTIIDTFLKKTEENIKLNPNKIALTFWTPLEGYQLKGKATIFNEGSLFEKNVNKIKSIFPFLEPKNCIIIKIYEASIFSPGYEAKKRINF